ncbi:ankyrin repeat domain-containing protein 34B [Dunckerocampus dactyliophorus]|uniref:ankyrin repeat domain-containing protein 34B n=1 Tax=Dunckerocampus dactyliophorus TaxID=161453 RepID=UPI0024051620|nr:ankyrin repeat domain-containing protein 34B [Dunckerocampus dactyliophorus]
MLNPMSDSSSLISAAASGKLRLVRLLVEGGAHVDGRNSRGETALLAACKALRGEPPGPEAMKIITYLLQKRADPNTRDKEGQTALMYACMEGAGAQVASLLLSAGADPSMEDHSGASALVYAVNTQDEPTLKKKGSLFVLARAECPDYLDVHPTLDTSSSVSCMSPSDIVLKTCSPNSSDCENIFNFKGTGQRGSIIKPPFCDLLYPPPRQRMFSEPCLNIPNLDRLTRAYEEGLKARNLRGERGREDLHHSQSRRNTFPTGTLLLHLPPLVNKSSAPLQASKSGMVLLPHPPSSSSSSCRTSGHPRCLRSPSSPTPPYPPDGTSSSWSKRKLPRRHSVQLEHI